MRIETTFGLDLKQTKKPTASFRLTQIQKIKEVKELKHQIVDNSYVIEYKNDLKGKGNSNNNVNILPEAIDI